MRGQRETFVPGERNFNRFGGWLGKNSTYGKKMRLLEDVHVHLLASHACEPTREAIRLDYVPLLSLRMTHPLHNLPKVGFLHNLLSACWQGTMCPFMSFAFADVFFDLVCIGWQEEAVNKVVDTMDDYSLTQEDFDTIIDLSKFQGPSLLDGVPSAVKAALTKAYKQHEGERRVRSADLLPVLSLPGLKKAPKKPARLRLMNFEDAENGDSPKEELDSEEVEEQDSEEAEEEEADDENKLAVLNESHTGGVTVTLEEPGSKKGLCTWNFLVFNPKKCGCYVQRPTRLYCFISPELNHAILKFIGHTFPL
jgi:replication factor C subunit 1